MEALGATGVERFLELAARLDNISWYYDYAYALGLKKPHSNQTLPPEEEAPDGYSYLEWHLSWWFNGLVETTLPTRAGSRHMVMRMTADEGRKTLPATVCAAVGLPQGTHVEVTWIVCYVFGIRPSSVADTDGGLRQCSHRCIERTTGGVALKDHKGGWVCIDPACLVWESVPRNQQRGHSALYCTRVCVHKGCGKILCTCQEIHEPHCF